MKIDVQKMGIFVAQEQSKERRVCCWQFTAEELGGKSLIWVFNTTRELHVLVSRKKIKSTRIPATGGFPQKNIPKRWLLTNKFSKGGL